MSCYLTVIHEKMSSIRKCSRKAKKKVMSPSPDPNVYGGSSPNEKPMRDHQSALGDATGLDCDQLHMVNFAEDTFRADVEGQDMVDKPGEEAANVGTGSENAKVEAHFSNNEITLILFSHSGHFVY
ncbi:hypothetical protein YC2023_082367 [Brassica napus]